MLAFFVNLFAAVCYFARIVANATCTPGFLMFTEIRYADYLTTCPLLVLDLLWNLDAPYKCTCAGLILVTIFTGVAACTAKGAESYLWFVYGDIIFIIVYYITFVIVRERVDFFVAHAQSNMAIKAMYYVKFASACFFLIWIWFPLIWIVSPYCLGLISIELLDLLHMFLDVCAKSVYGVVLLWFRWNYDKKLLRNLDEQEFLSSGKDEDPAKKNRPIKVKVPGEEDEEKGRPFKFGADLEPAQSPEPLSPRRPVSSFSGLVQPFDPNAVHSHSASESHGKDPLGTGSRMLFESNRRVGGAGPGSSGPQQHRSPLSSPQHRPMSSPMSRGINPAVSVPRLPLSEKMSPRSPRDEIRTHTLSSGYRSAPTLMEEAWLDDVARLLEDRGVAPHAVPDAVRRLDESGIIEDQLRTCITEEDLQEVGLDPAVRRIILAHYRPGAALAPSQRTPPARFDPAPVEMQAWTPRLLT
jgi:bacteriorhodopsin